MIYTHVLARPDIRVVSPLDRLEVNVPERDVAGRNVELGSVLRVEESRGESRVMERRLMERLVMEGRRTGVGLKR